MGTKHVVWGSLCLFAFFIGTAAFADIISGSGQAGYQSWETSDLNHNGKPYWDNKSIDGTTSQQKKDSNIGFNLVNPVTSPLDSPPHTLPYWGNSGKSKRKNGGNADLNFFFDRTGVTNAATLKLEIDPAADLDEFGWYDIADPSDLHPIFLGPDSPVSSDTFTPSAEYGFYLKRGDEATFYTQSTLNPYKDTSHQHFVVFQESATPGAEIYWIGIENQTKRELKHKEGGLGDYNDMLIRVSCLPQIVSVPEPSTGFLVLSGLSLVSMLARYRRK